MAMSLFRPCNCLPTNKRPFITTGTEHKTACSADANIDFTGDKRYGADFGTHHLLKSSGSLQETSSRYFKDFFLTFDTRNNLD